MAREMAEVVNDVVRFLSPIYFLLSNDHSIIKNNLRASKPSPLKIATTTTTTIATTYNHFLATTR